MNSSALARNLAQSLALAIGRWSEDAIRRTLVRRFPRQLESLAAAIGVTLFQQLPHLCSPSAEVIGDALERTAPFDKVYDYCREHDVWPGADLTPPAMSPVAAFGTLSIPQLPTLGALADWLFLPMERLDYLADVHSRFETHGDKAVNHYHYILQAKKSGRLRIIEAPKRNLKAAQRQILHEILDNVPVHLNAFGFVKGRNCRDAATRHVGEQVVICFDVKDFFPSISAGRVFGLFRCLGYPYEVARTLSGLCTTIAPSRVVNQLAAADRSNYRRSHLPQGSPASPALANLTVFNLDRRLAALAKRSRHELQPLRRRPDLLR